MRCSEEEKTRIQKRAERTGKNLEFCREALLTGEIVAVPQLGEHEREAIRSCNGSATSSVIFPT
ncbi:plasmid mobilization protein [Chryseobacterium gallinarum]|uniref:plasmid mobilization protein n=1 Tax=Chryseobacterium gallinarum TaxID=1324352 RepID=UPI00373FC8D4